MKFFLMKTHVLFLGGTTRLKDLNILHDFPQNGLRYEEFAYLSPLLSAAMAVECLQP
jgi:hypothetical protein